MKRKKGKFKLHKLLIFLTIVVLLVTLVDISMRLVSTNKQMVDLYVRQEQLNKKIDRVDQTYADMFSLHQERLNELDEKEIHNEINTNENKYAYEEESNINLDTDTMWIATILAGIGTLVTGGKIIRGF